MKLTNVAIQVVLLSDTNLSFSHMFLTSEWKQRKARGASVPVHSLARSRRARVSHPLPQLPTQSQSLQPP